MTKKNNDPFDFNKAINWKKLEDPKVIEELQKLWKIIPIEARSTSSVILAKDQQKLKYGEK